MNRLPSLLVASVFAAAACAHDIPVVTAIEAVGSDIWIGVGVGNGVRYLFEETVDLAGGKWTPVLEFVGTGGIETFIDPDATILSQRFYRVGLVIPQ